MTAADITNATNAQVKYSKLLTSPRDGIVTRSTDNKDLHKKVDALRPTLVNIDLVLYLTTDSK